MMMVPVVARSVMKENVARLSPVINSKAYGV